MMGRQLQLLLLLLAAAVVVQGWWLPFPLPVLLLQQQQVCFPYRTIDSRSVPGIQWI